MIMRNFSLFQKRKDRTWEPRKNMKITIEEEILEDMLEEKEDKKSLRNRKRKRRTLT